MIERVRIQKLLSQCGICSRREAEDLIRKEKVLLNGVLATLGDRATTRDTITIHGKKVTLVLQTKKTIAWNKPIGVEVTLSPARDKTYKTLLDFDFGKERFFPVGRLDKNSRGLLLLTTDGELANTLMHPRYEKEKEYLVTVQKGRGTKNDNLNDLAKRMSRGLLVDHKKTKPCRVEVIDDQTLRFVLKEGRNRQIRKMCEAVGYDVIDLLRTRFGVIDLGALHLAEGHWKEVEISL